MDSSQFLDCLFFSIILAGMRGGITAGAEISRLFPTMTSATARLELKLLNDEKKLCFKDFNVSYAELE